MFSLDSQNVISGDDLLDNNILDTFGIELDKIDTFDIIESSTGSYILKGVDDI